MTIELWLVAGIVALAAALIAWGFITPTSRSPSVLMPQPTRQAPPVPECKPSAVPVMPPIVINPGDALVVTCDRVLTVEQVARIRAGMIDNLPKGCKIVVLHGGLSLASVAKAADTTE
jgi:hypothetical protein